MNVEVKNGGIQTGPHVCKYLSIYSFRYCFTNMGFPESSVGKESACNAGYPGLIPGSGRSAGEGIGYPLQYSWASLVALLVKNPPAIQRPGFDPWRAPWRRERLLTPVFWPGEVHGLYSPWGCKKSDMTMRLSLLLLLQMYNGYNHMLKVLTY